MKYHSCVRVLPAFSGYLMSKIIIYMKLFSKIVSSFQDKLQQLQPIAKSSAQSLQLHSISPQLYQSKFIQNIGQLKTLNRHFHPHQPIQLWNLSEYSYPQQLTRLYHQHPELSNIQIIQMNYQFYTTLPISVAILAVRKIEKFIRASPNNAVVIHCQQNRCRSILFLVGYLCLTNKVSDAAEALQLVLDKIKSQEGVNIGDIQSRIYGSQHHILRNIINYHKDNSCINRNHIQLDKIIINPYPIINQVPASQPLVTIIQIRNNNSVIYKQKSSHQIQSIDQFLKFEFRDRKNPNNIDKQVRLHDDCLISLKYVNNKKLYPILRIQINTNFMDGNFIRIPMMEMDIVQGDDQSKKRYIFADIFFREIPDSYSQLGMLQQNGVNTAVDQGQVVVDSMSESKEAELKLVTKQKQEDVFEINEDELEIKDDDINQMLRKLEIKEKIKQEQLESVRKEEEELNRLQQEQRKNREPEAQPSESLPQKQQGQNSGESQNNRENDKEAWEQQQLQQSKTEKTQQTGNEELEQISEYKTQSQKQESSSSNKQQIILVEPQQIKQYPIQQQNITQKTPNKLNSPQISQSPSFQELEDEDINIDEYLKQLEKQA